MPKKDSFDFALTPTRSSTSSSAATTSLLSDTYKQAVGICLLGSKGRNLPNSSSDDEDYDTPLAKRWCKLAEEKVILPSASEMEEDSVEECLQGNSVIDPLVPEQPTAVEANQHDTTANLQNAPATTMQPVPEAMSSPEQVDHETSSMIDTSTPTSLFSSGTIDLPSPSCHKNSSICWLRHRYQLIPPN